MNRRIYLIIFITGLLSGFVSSVANEEQPIVVVIPSYRNAQGDLYKKTLDSVLNQQYGNFRIVYVVDDDFAADSDNTGAAVENYIKERGVEDKVTLVRNRSRQLALRNIYKAALSCADEEIIAIVDGDGDLLAHPYALAHVNDLYQAGKTPVWFSYGNFQPLSTQQAWGLTIPIPDNIIDSNSLRSWMNGPTHLKTFKAWLFKQIKIEDLFYDGDFFRMAYDVALFTPMLEMARDRYAHTREVLYTYNDLNPINDHKVNRGLQQSLDTHIRHKVCYQPLAASMSGVLDTKYHHGAFKVDVILLTADTVTDRMVELLQEHNFSSSIGTVHVYGASVEDEAAATKVNQAVRIVYYDAVNVKDVLRLIGMASTCDYVLLARDVDALPTIDYQDAVYWLETTHAHRFYAGLGIDHYTRMFAGRTFNPDPVGIGIDEPPVAGTVYAWQYQDNRLPEIIGMQSLPIIRKDELKGMAQSSAVNTVDDIDRWLVEHAHAGEIGLFYRR